MRKKKCKACGNEFQPERQMQTCCSYVCAMEYVKQSARKRVRRETRAALIKLKTRSEWLKDAQKVFNEYIRLRDADKGCISCGRPLIGKYDAGHYRTVAACPELRFNEFNVMGQDVHCNQHKHGNVLEYRIGLIKRIGQDKVDWLEGPHEPKKYTIDEIQALIAEYKSKIAALKRERDVSSLESA